MDSKQFLAEFGHIVSAPNGIRCLKDVVLNLAVTGKLVEGDFTKNANELIETIKLKKEKHLEPRKVVSIQDKIFSTETTAPINWAKCCLGDLILSVTGGGTPAKINPNYWDGDIPWASVKDIKDHKYLDTTQEKITQKGLENSSTNLIPMNRAIVCTRMGLGKIVINRIATAINQDMKALEIPSEVDMDFFYILYKTRNIKGKGTTVSGINQKALFRLPAVLPPMEEQKRIVAKVGELMVLCDKLEAQQQKREELCKRTRTTALDALANAQTPDELFRAWMRVRGNMNLLMDVVDSFPEFRNAIIRLAVRGLLSPKTSERVDVDKIVAECDRLRKEYIQNKWIRRQKSVPEVQIDQNFFPDHWAIEQFDRVAVVIGGVTKGRNLKDRKTAAYPYLRVANVQRGYFALSEMKELSIPVEEFDKYQLFKGDLLTAEGGDWDKVGRTAIWQGEIDNCIHQNHVFKSRVPSELILNEWVELVFNSDVGREYFAKASKQTTNLASINMTQLRSFPLPIPPTGEQKAILKKVKTLLSYCDQIEDKVSSASETAERLAVASVSSLTGTQIQEKQKMKAPKTQLITKLTTAQPPKIKDDAPLTAILMKHNNELSAKALWHHSGMEIDDFYRQLKTEMANGWIIEPEKARMKEVEAA